MLFSLLPTTALAASPTYVRVYNESGKLISLSDGQYLAQNSDSSASSGYTDGTSYVARYEKSSGTLYLNGYHGVATEGGITALGDLNIEVVSNSSFTTSKTSTDDLYGIQANGGNLNITGTGKLTVTANGNGTVYGIYADKGVTISAPLVVNVGKVDSSKNGSLYGIYTKSGAISLSDRDKNVTATGGTSNVYGVYNAADTSTTITNNGNIDISGTLTVNLINGSVYNRGISSQGGVITLNDAEVNIPKNHYYGIYNYNGNVIIENGSKVELASTISGGEGICASAGGDLRIENSTVKVSAHGYAANPEKGNLSIKNSDVELTKTSDITALVVNTADNAANKIDLSTSGSVTLTAPGNQSGKMIGGKLSITSGTKKETGTYYESYENYDGEYDGSSKTILKFVHETTTPTATVANVTIDGTTGTAIADKDVVITLTNDTFKSTLSGDWITNLPTNLSQSVSKTDDTHAKITVSGNPSETSSAPLIIKIPAANLVTSTSDLDVTSNTKAKFAITAPTYSVNIVAGANMSTSGTASQSGLTGAMTEVVYTADTGYYFPTDYSSVGKSDGVTVKRDSYTQITVSGTPTGTVNITLADARAKTKETQPGATFTATGPDSGTLSNLVNGGEYAVTGAAVANFTASSMTHDLNDVSAGTLSIVKNGNGTTTTDSTAQTITVNKATAPTGVTPVGCTTDSNNDGKLENVTADMEYQKSGAGSWTPCGGTEVANLTNGTYLVRVKATGMTLASDNQTVIINAYGTPPAAQPDASFTATGRDAGTLVISGTYTSTMQYSVDGGIGWNAVTSASMDITGVTAANGIQVKDVGNGTTTSASSVKSITVTEGTKPTGLTVTQPNTIGGKGKIETDTSHEYNTDGGTTFTACTGALDNLNAGAYHVRVKANGTMLASETKTYTITAFTGTPETQPGATFTATGPDSGTLRNLVSGGKYAVTGAATTNFTASGTTHDLTGVVAGTLSIVKKGDGIITTDSTAQTIPVAKAATPSSVTAVGCTTSSNNDGKLQNVTNAMEYQKSGDAAWTPGTGSEISGLINGTYLVRVKATGTTLASDNQSAVVAVYTGGGTSSGGSSGGGYVPTTQKPEIKAGEGGSIVLSKDGTTATITPNAGMMIDKVMLNGKDMGALTVVKGIKTGDKLEVSFKQTAEEKAKMDKAVVEQVAKAGLTARSARTAKKNVKLVVKSDLEGITDAGYTVEYKFYRSTKKSAGYKAVLTKKASTYVNTYGKKGMLYYYKVKVMVYDKDGNLTAQTALKQCKYASRLWTK